MMYDFNANLHIAHVAWDYQLGNYSHGDESVLLMYDDRNYVVATFHKGYLTAHSKFMGIEYEEAWSFFDGVRNKIRKSPEPEVGSSSPHVGMRREPQHEVPGGSLGLFASMAPMLAASVIALVGAMNQSLPIMMVALGVATLSFIPIWIVGSIDKRQGRKRIEEAEAKEMQERRS